MYPRLTEPQYDGLYSLAMGFMPPTNTVRALQKRGLVTDHFALTIHGRRIHAARQAELAEPLHPDAQDWPFKGTLGGDFLAAARMNLYPVAGHNRSMRRTQRVNAIETNAMAAASAR